MLHKKHKHYWYILAFGLVALLVVYVAPTITKSIKTAQAPDKTDLSTENDQPEKSENISVSAENQSNETSTKITDSEPYDHPNLTSAQEDALYLIGIDPGMFANGLTAEQEKCLIDEFGEARLTEIKNGATPGVLEVLRAKDCL